MMFRPITQAIQSNSIFKVSYILGIFPFRVIDNELKLNKLLVLCSLVLSTCFAILYTYNDWMASYYYRIQMYQEGRTFDYFMLMFCFLFQLFSLFLLPFCFYFNRNELIETVHILDSLEPFFNKLEGKAKKRPIEEGSVLKELSVPLICVLVLYFNGNTWYNIPISLGIMFVFVEINLNCGQFNGFVDTVCDFFESGSKFLLRMKRPVSLVNLMRLEKLVAAISKLVTASDKINAAYSEQLLVTIFTCYGSMMSFLYYFYLNCNSSYGLHHPHLLGDVIMILYHLYVAWRLSSLASKANKKVWACSVHFFLYIF